MERTVIKIILMSFASLLLQSAGLAQGVIIRGRVVESGTDQPVVSAKVRLRSNSGALLSTSTEPVSLNGSFEIRLESFNEGALRCEISAPSFEPRRLTLPVTNGVADAGLVRMSRTRTLKLAGLLHAVSADGQQQYLDVFAVNEASTPVEVRSVRLLGSAKRGTGCADPAPGIIFAIKDIGEGRRAAPAADVSVPNNAFRDSISIAGQLSFLPCDQIRMDFNIPWLFSMSANERIKLRVSIPRQVKRDGNAERKSLALENWDTVVLRVRLSDGREIDAGTVRE